jgi:hypothetical protein
MHDNLGQLLRDGTSQVAQDLTPAPAHLVRARGSQRSRRKAAGTTVLAVVLIAAGGGGAYALSQQPHSAPSVVTPLTQTPTPTAPATTPGPTITPTQLNTPTGTATPPGGTVATTPPPSASASSATTAPATVITVCRDPAVPCSGAEMQTEPTDMSSTADGSRTVSGISWSGWGSATATGTGTMGVDNCDPTCANGTYSYYPATVILSGLKPYLSGTEGYDTIVFNVPTYPDQPTMTFKEIPLPTSTNSYAPPTTTGT